jgi:DNA-binding response OmpR family regulator
MARIMIVEDEPQVLVLAESILKEAGHETRSAANHNGAVALLEGGERPDLLFVDHNLGEGLSGIDTAREARRLHAAVRVLYTSGDLMNDGMRAMFVEGADFLPKPYTPEQLLERVAALLSKPSTS